MTCKCGKPLVASDGREGSTLVGFYSPPGHDHDDNCRKRWYLCEDGHVTCVSRQNRCPACGWRGIETCFCCVGPKVKEWPEIAANAKIKNCGNVSGNANLHRRDTDV